MDPGAQKLCLGFGSVLLHVEFIVKQEGCRQLWAYVTSSRNSYGNNVSFHNRFGVESFIGSDGLPLLDPGLEVFSH